MTRWSDEKTVQFIRLYRENECLWNSNTDLYKNKTVRYNAYVRIQEEMNDMTITEIKNKIRGIRCTYHQELNKVINSKLSGGSYAPSLIWFNEMDFLNDTFEYRKAIIKDMIQPSSSQTSTASDQKPHSSSQTLNVSERQPSKKRPLEDIKKAVEGKRRHLEQTDTLTALQCLRSITTAINQKSNEDEFYYFGQSVAAQLRSLPIDKALDIQSKIQNLLTKERSRLSKDKSSTTYSDTIHLDSEDSLDTTDFSDS